MQRPVSQLTVHPAVALAWEMPPDHPRFLSLVVSIHEQGLLEPVKITEDGRVVDGRHRLRAAREAGLEMIECQVVPEERVGEIALATLCERRHLVTRGQLAYAAYPLFERGHREAQQRNAELIRRGARPAANGGGATVEKYADQVGVGAELFRQSARLHAMFDERPELREEWEPKIMSADEPIGLGAAIAGIRGQETSSGRTPQRNTALHNWEVAWRNIIRPAAAWGRWNDDEREHAAKALREQFVRLPEPVLDAVSNALRAARRARPKPASGPEAALERLGLLSPREAADDDGAVAAEVADSDPETSRLNANDLARIRSAAATRWAKNRAADYRDQHSEGESEVPALRAIEALDRVVFPGAVAAAELPRDPDPAPEPAAEAAAPASAE